MKVISGIALIIALALAPTVFAQNAGTLELDADLFTPGIQAPGPYSLASGGNIVLYLVLTNVEDLIGMSTDIKFDPNVLQLAGAGLGVTEDRGDVNFDGKVNMFDIVELITERQARGSGATPIAYYDLNEDGNVDVFDVVRVVNNRKAADSGVNFWTNTRAGAMALPQAAESVEIFDNDAPNGLLDDLDAVLLISPVGGVRNDTDRGFDSDAQRTDPATQNATIARLEFLVVAQTPQSTVIDILAGETQGKLDSLGPSANNAVVLHEGKTVDQLAHPAGNDATITITP